MNNSARHESSHSVAIFLLQLTNTLRPGGAAITSSGRGGVVSLACDTTPNASGLIRLADRLCNSTEPCGTVVDAAREQPELVPSLILFMLAGYAATPEEWRGDFGQTICVRTSSDFNTARQIVLDLIGSTGWTAENFASEQVRDALDRAYTWAGQDHVRLMIDRVATHLEKHGAATWAELTTLFSTAEDNVSLDRDPASIAVPDACPLAGTESGTLADTVQPTAVENLSTETTTQKKVEDNEK